MEQALSTFVRSIFVDNMIFAYYLGMCSFLAVSKNVKTAMGLGIAVTFILVCTLPINYMLENYVLKEGALSWLGPQFADVNLSFLAFILFIAIIARSRSWSRWWSRSSRRRSMPRWVSSCPLSL